MRRGLDLLVVGALWGVAAYLLGRRAFGPAIWAGVLLAPAIGLVVGSLLQAPFERAEGRGRSGWALLSLYLGATLFGLVIGIGTWVGFGTGTRRFPEVMVEPLLGTWWGITLTGFFLVLWPLAYGTHRWLEWRGYAR